jgi:hypothetical protein
MADQLFVLDGNGLLVSLAEDSQAGTFYPIVKGAFGSLHAAYTLVDDLPGQRYPTLSSRKIAQFAAPIATQIAAYANGNNVGGLFSFLNFTRNNADGVHIKSVVYSDNSGQNAPAEIWLFNGNPNGAGSVITDKTAFALGTADLAKVVAILQIGSFFSAGVKGVAFIDDIESVLIIPGATTIYGAVVLRGASTFIGAADLTLAITVEQD